MLGAAVQSETGLQCKCYRRQDRTGAKVRESNCTAVAFLFF